MIKPYKTRQTTSTSFQSVHVQLNQQRAAFSYIFSAQTLEYCLIIYFITRKQISELYKNKLFLFAIFTIFKIVTEKIFGATEMSYFILSLLGSEHQYGEANAMYRVFIWNVSQTISSLFHPPALCVILYGLSCVRLCLCWPCDGLVTSSCFPPSQCWKKGQSVKGQSLFWFECHFCDYQHSIETFYSVFQISKDMKSPSQK